MANKEQVTKQGKSPPTIFQIKIALKNISPPIWRRFQVSGNTNLYRLHEIIQVLMGWFNYHLFQFTIDNVRYGILDENKDTFWGLPTQDAKLFNISRVLQEGKKFNYEYDFGDSWEMRVTVEKVLPAEKELKNPVCLKGKRAGPPEDCGGICGYEEIVEILKTPPDKDEDEDVKERREWIGEDYDPEYYDLKEINRDLKIIDKIWKDV